MLTIERLHELLHYDAETGVFIRRKTIGRARCGAVAGGLMSLGYWAIGIDGVAYYGHRLAWLYMTGAWPAEQVDHVDGTRNNNRWANLREASSGQNKRNTKLKASNTSGYKGVSFCAGRSNQKKAWEAKIRVNYKTVHLGRFATGEEAARAYDVAAVQHSGQFARLNFP